jgi:hypothetical protein
MRTLGLALAVASLWTGVLCGHAEARREQTYPYPFSRVWTAAVRMLRVDFESPITEKDKDSGYFLFNFNDGKKEHPGSVEVIRTLENGVESVRVVVQVPALASYVERMLLDRLGRKLTQEYGAPPAPKTPPADATPNDPQKDKAPADGDAAPKSDSGESPKSEDGEGSKSEGDANGGANAPK